jgi:predicted phage terminase large subunit-like protein
MTQLAEQVVHASELLLARRQVRSSLAAWARHCGFEPQPHHLLFIDRLEALQRRQIKRLMIYGPPGCAKSTYVSKLFPTYYQVIAASHTDALALDFSRHNRKLISTYASALGIDIASDNMAAGHWATTAGGSYLACGTGQAIMGFRADLIVIDDPIASRADADSENVRNSIWTWYSGDLTTRLRPGGLIVLIMTRYHEDDLSGRLLARMAAGGEQWDVLSLPAEAEEDDPLGREPGVMLWEGDPSYSYVDTLREAKVNQDARNWSAMYQQRPTPDTGDYFKEEWLKPYPSSPDLKSMSVYAASDFAVTSKGGDFTVHIVVGLDPDGEMWLLDCWRKQAASDVWVESLCDLIRKWQPYQWALEKGQITSGIGPHLKRRMRERNAHVGFEEFPTRGDKAVRAQSIRGRMASSGIYVPMDASWYPDLRSELLHFPAGKHDDIVDALGLAGQLLATMIPGRKKKVDGFHYDHTTDPYRSSRDDVYSDYVQSSVKLI